MWLPRVGGIGVARIAAAAAIPAEAAGPAPNHGRRQPSPQLLQKLRRIPAVKFVQIHQGQAAAGLHDGVPSYRRNADNIPPPGAVDYWRESARGRRGDGI